ncbi:MAG TPA: N-methyl-L-tryptophan oxidase [Candidatus Limnocylindria bacterium]|nr:N-methyl-L-tryptophan oxidase [Candidatus Limnocylindria bacterium]
MAGFDVAVIGLGAMGSAAAYHLASRGARVLGLERFERGHTRASFGGRSRIIRLAYFEHPDYVPLLRSAWAGWRALEAASGETLLTQTGGLYAGPPGGELVGGALRSAREHGLAHEVLDAAETMRRYPALRLDPGWTALLEEQAGWLAPERCIETHLRLAERAGATLRFGAPAGVRRDGDGLAIGHAGQLDHGDRVVLTAGAWLPVALPFLAPVLEVHRVPLFWFDPVGPVGPLPVWIMGTPDGDYYGFPPDEHGLKVARHGTGDPADPDALDRAPRPADEERVRAFARRHLPAADGPLRDTHVCMYTRTPDGHFVIDRADERTVYASACSGHGFKFASVVGEILADLALDGRTSHPIGFLSAARLLA